jgi:hypothetical protein
MVGRATALVASAVTIAVAAIGCGSSSSAPAKSGGSSGLPAATSAALKLRLSAGPTFQGEKVTGSPLVQTGAAYIAGDNDATDGAQLRADGLQGAASEHIQVPGTADGLRLVLLFGSSGSASQRAQEQLKNAPAGSKAAVFPVPAIPGASGLDVSASNGALQGRNVVFVVNSYVYILGVAPGSGSKAAPSRDDIVHIATAWYSQVKSLA